MSNFNHEIIQEIELELKTLNDYEDSLTLLESKLLEFPQNQYLLCQMAIVLNYLEKYLESDTILHSINLEDEYSEYYYYAKAVNEYENDSISAALIFLEEARRINRICLSAINLTCKIYSLLGKQDLIIEITSKLSKDETDSIILSYLARAYLCNGQEELALKIALESIADSPNFSAYETLALLNSEPKHKRNKAIEYYIESLKYEPENKADKIKVFQELIKLLEKESKIENALRVSKDFEEELMDLIEKTDSSIDLYLYPIYLEETWVNQIMHFMILQLNPKAKADIAKLNKNSPNSKYLNILTRILGAFESKNKDEYYIQIDELKNLGFNNVALLNQLEVIFKAEHKDHIIDGLLNED